MAVYHVALTLNALHIINSDTPKETVQKFTILTQSRENEINSLELAYRMDAATVLIEIISPSGIFKYCRHMPIIYCCIWVSCIILCMNGITHVVPHTFRFYYS